MAAAGGAAVPQLVRHPTLAEHALVGDILAQWRALTATSKPAPVLRRVAAAAQPISVSVDDLVGRPVSDMIVALRSATWLSPALASTFVVVLLVDVPGAAAAAPVIAAMPGIDHATLVARGSTYDVYEVFSTTPCPLYRTVTLGQLQPCVRAADGGNAFSAFSPIALGEFAARELDLGPGGVFAASLTGLSASREHEGLLGPLQLLQPPPPGGAAAAPAAAVLLADALDRNAAQGLVASYDPGVLGVLGLLGPLDDTIDIASVPAVVPSNGTKTQVMFCFKLDAGVDLAPIGFCVIYDNNSVERLGHFSLQRYGPLARVPWVMDANLLVSRQPGADPAPDASAEVFPLSKGAVGPWAAPVLASRFKLHCLVMRGRAAVTSRFNPDEPGADVDVADALEVCASLVPEHDRALLDLLEGCEAAHYSLARMGGELRGELAAALESASACDALPSDDVLVLDRAALRLSEWGAGDGTGTILEYAAGPEVHSTAELPAGGTDVPIIALLLLLRDALSIPPARLAEVLSVAASSVPRAIAILRSSSEVAVSAQIASPQVYLHHVCTALDAPHASVWAVQAHSTELLLRGVPLASMPGVMSDLEDPLAQRVLLTCAMLALEQLTTDTPVFVFAAPRPPLPSAASADADADASPDDRCSAPEPRPVAAIAFSSAESSEVALHRASPLGVSACAAAEAEEPGQHQLHHFYARCFRGTERPLAMALHAAQAAERTLADVSADMWGQPAVGLAGSSSFCTLLSGTPTLSSHVPLYAQLLRDCADAVAVGAFTDAAVGVAAAGGPLILRALPGEALFVLLTSSRRAWVDAPALVVQLLRAHGFPDARIGGAWESGQKPASG